jgi:hypothetical protein
VSFFLAAWLAAEGIVVYRWVKLKAPPTPGALALPSGLFVGLALLADYPPARGFAIAMAAGVDLAVLVQVLGKAPTGATGWPPAVTAAGGAAPAGATSVIGAAVGAAKQGTSERQQVTGLPGSVVPGLP